MLKLQVNKIVGLGAPVEFVTTLEELANAHHHNMQVDVIRAYHFGARFIVEASHVPSNQMTISVTRCIVSSFYVAVENLLHHIFLCGGLYL